MHHNVQTYATVDPAQKTVTVPPGSKGLKGELKKVLFELGWRLSVDRGPSVMEGKLGEDTKIENYDTFNTRYRLHVAASQYDICLNSSPAITYEISFVDNQTGSEVFTIEGNGCQTGAIEEFKKAIGAVSKK
jgi:hypothetical protein